MTSWAEKYRPDKLKDVFGQEKAKVIALDFIKNFKKQKKNALLLHGPTGTGKTALVYALAAELHLEILELNASDFRNKQQIDEVIGKALQQRSLFSKSKVILVDELDGISGTKDRGGLLEIIRLIEESNYPIILVCNNPWKDNLRALRTKVIKVEFLPLDLLSLKQIVSRIAKQEGISISERALLKELEVNCGDARGILNDLQVLAITNKDIHEKDVESLGVREKEQEIFQAVRKVLKTRKAENAFDNVDLDLDALFLWLDENLPLEYHGPELERAYETLSLADLYKGRIIKRQHWRFLSYIHELISQGVAVAKYQDKPGFTKYSPPSRILKLWIAKQKNLKKKEIAKKLGKYSHCSVKQAMQDLDILKIALKRDATLRTNFIYDLNLGEESDWIMK